LAQWAGPFENESRESRYSILFEVGWSGLARSHLAIDRGSGHGANLVVMHVAPPQVVSDDERRARFALRAAALLRLRHPNVVRALSHVADGGNAHWVSEAVQGQPLSVLMRVRPRTLSPLQLARVLCDVLRGLECLHGAVDAEGRPIVHGSLSPASVLVSYDGRVKLDVSAAPGFPTDCRGALAAHALRSAYQAPECLQGLAPDHRSDLYAVGAMLWEGVTGRSLSSPLRPSEPALALELAEPSEWLALGPELANASPGVLPALSALCRRVLAPNPAARHQSARELLNEIEALDLAEAFRGEQSSLFGFMCNHFYEEHAALQELLAERAPGVNPEPPASGEGPAGDPPERVTSVPDLLSERVTLVGEPPRRSIVPVLPSGEVARAASPAEALESSPNDPRFRRALIALSLAGAAAVGALVAQPSPPERSSPEPTPPILARQASPAPAAGSQATGGDAPPTADTPMLDERWTARRARFRPEQPMPSTAPPVHTPGAYGADDGVGQSALPAPDRTAVEVQAERPVPRAID
jgi:eukaryotic-like serine/threonine-protein kinase